MTQGIVDGRVPGPSALAWSWIIRGGCAALFVLVIAGLMIDDVVIRRTTVATAPIAILVLYVLGFGVVYGVPYLVRRFGWPNEFAEVRRGYTTLWGRHSEVTQLDPLRGTVVRVAGAPAVSRRYLDDAEVLRLGMAAPGLGPRIGPTLLQFAIIPIGILFAYTYVRSEAFLVTQGLAIGCVVAILFIAGYSVRQRRRLASVVAAAPHEFAFTTYGELPTPLRAFAIRPDSEFGVSVRTGYTAGEHGLTLWSGTPLQPLSFVPWSAVSAVDLGPSSGRSGGLFGREDSLSVEVTGVNGPMRFILRAPNAQALWAPGRAEADWVQWNLASRWRAALAR